MMEREKIKILYLSLPPHLFMVSVFKTDIKRQIFINFMMDGIVCASLPFLYLFCPYTTL